MCSVGFYQMSKIAVTPTIVIAEFILFSKTISSKKVSSSLKLLHLLSHTFILLGFKTYDLLVGKNIVFITKLLNVTLSILKHQKKFFFFFFCPYTQKSLWHVINSFISRVQHPSFLTVIV